MDKNKKKRVLVPVDGSERSMHSLDFLKTIYLSNSVEVLIMHVKELVIINEMVVADEIQESQKSASRILEEAEKYLSGYDVETYFTFGYASHEIVKKANEENIDIIIMTKSTKKGLTRMIGSVTTYVVKHSNSIIMIVPE